MSMFSNYDSTVNSLYLAFYGRPADPSGLQFWSKALADNNGNADTIIQAFAASQEAQTRFGSDTVNARITDIYEQLFNRAPDAAGLAFWTNAVEQGSATLAEVSLAILKGAQSSDLDLSTLRQKAADAFTAAVEDGSTEYSGYASIEAARVLVRAVTTDATDADLAKLVKAAVSFADTATKNPKVVDAIATGSTLLNLYDSARGLKDPVALTQALADTAKAAAGDPVTLESLLRGGGMDKVLKVMPAKATLTDVVEALAKGGLPAAVEVVYPTKPVVTPTPVPSTPMKLTFESVSQGPFDTNKKDNVTNVEVATVKFSYTGSDLKAGQGFQYSIDGVNWTSKNVSADPLTKIVTIKGVHLTGQNTSSPSNSESSIQTPLYPIGNVITTVQVRAVDAAKNVIADAAGKIEYDSTPPSGFVEYKGIVYGNSCTLTDPVATFQKIAILDHDIIQWHIEGAADWIDVKDFKEDGSFSLKGLDLGKGDQKVELRVIDAAGNVGFENARLIEGQGGHQPSPTFSLTPSIGGLVVDSNFAGTLQLLDGKEAAAIKSIDGSSTANVGITTIRAQDAIVSGTFQIKPDNALAIKDGNVYDYVYTFGTGKADIISGQVVWGFDGDDVLTGADEGAYLFGGNGNDTLTGGAGPDTIVGGIGADKIYLGKDSVRDIVYYELGDAAGAVFVDGGSTAALDVINGFDDLDRIEFANYAKASSIAGSSYLTTGATNGVAVVRGSDKGGVFNAGSADSDDDYMVQWGDGAQVNSVIVHNYGVLAPTVSVQQLLGPMGPSTGISFSKPLPSAYTGMHVNLAGNPGGLQLLSDAGAVTSLAKQSGLMLTSLNSGAPVPADNYVDSANVMEGRLYSNAAFNTGLYQLTWDNSTFMTGSRVLGAGQQLFAGGKDGKFVHEGIVLKGLSYVHGTVERGNAIQENRAFIADGTGDLRIHTGGGNDVIVDHGSKLTIAYSNFDDSAHDIILGFDQEDDVFAFEGSAAAMLDKGAKNGDLDWVANAPGAILADTEAVYVTVKDMMVFGSQWGGNTTASTLRGVLDVSAIAKGDSLLILADDTAGNGGALLLYTNRDDNGVIDAGDLTTVAMFGDGVAGHADIHLVGLQQNEQLLP